MDPYVEKPSRWSGFHTRFIARLSDFLAEAVAPDYFVSIEERVSISQPTQAARQQIAPDVFVVTAPAGPVSGGSATAVVEQIQPPTLVEPLEKSRLTHRYLEIVDAETRTVVTIIELLSPFNKRGNSVGRRAFLRKRRQVLQSRTHWLEVDLLRGGQRPAEVVKPTDYYSLLSRATETAQPYEVWFFGLRDALPTVAVPLQSPHADVALPLQSLFEQVYQRAYYARSINYDEPVRWPTLAPAEAQWAAQRIAVWQR